MIQRAVKELTADDCLTLLKSCNVGRIVFVDDSGPGAVPVNYGVAADEIIVRVAEDSSLRRLIQAPIAFEVDQTDAQQSEAWSILVRGSGREVPLADVAQLLQIMHETLPRPWAEGVHNHWLAVKIESITGRRLGGSLDAAV